MHLIVIGGPTASGKTSIATSLAQQLNADVISADSRQVYRGLDLGTGKDLKEFTKFNPPIRHHLIDILDVEGVYSLIQFQQDCYRVLKELAEKGLGRKERKEKSIGRSDVAVMVGGSGMYVESVLRRYRIANVPENPEYRATLLEKSHEDLEHELRVNDPEQAARTDLSSRKRIVRALEIWDYAQSGRVPFSALPELDFSSTLFVTLWDRAELRIRINLRLEDRLRSGMVEEVSGLLKRGVKADRLRLLGMEYREITDYLAGVKTYDTMVEDLRHQIHLLAKRQETYFRGMEKRGVPVHWLRKGDGAEAILKVLSMMGLSFA